MTLWYVYTINDQEVDKELQLSRTECIELQRNIAELQLKWSREKDSLKRATKYSC